MHRAAGKLLGVTLLIACIFSANVAAQQTNGANGVIVRAVAEPATGAVIGQRIALSIDVLFPDDMPFPPRLSLPTVPGAQILRLGTQALTIREHIGTADYVGRRFELSLYPRRGGDLAIPPVSITLLNRAQEEIGTVASPAVLVHVTVPPGVDPSQPVVASDLVTMTEEWSPPTPSGLKVGDALRRTITRRAADVLGLALNTLDFDVADGVRVYVDPPQINDKIDRGDVTGERIDRVSYVLEKAGRYSIPALTQQWWDLRNSTVRTIVLPARQLSVAAAAADRGRQASNYPFTSRFWLAIVLIAVAIMVFSRWAWPRLGRAWIAWRAERAGSEAAAYATLKRAARSGHAAETYRALKDWLRHANVTEPWIDQDPIASWRDRLERSLFGGAVDSWTQEDAAGLVQAVRRTRHDHLHSLIHRHRRSRLPPLNPPMLNRS